MSITKKDAPTQVALGAGQAPTRASLSTGQVQHIAHLARIALTDAEVEKYEKELSLTLRFVDKLAEVDTENVKPLTGGMDLVNVVRDDINNSQLTTDLPSQVFQKKNLGGQDQQLELAAELVKAAPEHERGFIKVKKVFE